MSYSNFSPETDPRYCCSPAHPLWKSRGTGPDAVNRFRPTLLPTLLLTPASRGPRHVSGFYLGRFTLLYQETGEAEAGGGRFIPRLLVVCP